MEHISEEESLYHNNASEHYDNRNDTLLDLDYSVDWLIKPNTYFPNPFLLIESLSENLC